MGLPENIANEPLPIASLTALVKPEATVFPVNQPAPVSLQGAGQFRIVVENEEEEAEIVLVVGGASTGSWIVERAQEGTTALSFVAGTGISHELTAGAVKTFAPLNSPPLTGTPTAPTAAAKTSTTQLATTAFVETAKTEAEEALVAEVKVERERAEAAEGLLAPKASPALTGTPTAPTAPTLTNTTQVATTAYADGAVAIEKARAEGAEAAAVTTAESVAETSAKATSEAEVKTERERAEVAEALKAPLASPALTGSPTAPTQAAKDNSTKVATDAFVQTAVGEEATTRAAAVTAAITTAEAASDPAGTSVAGVKVEKERAEAAEALRLTTAEKGAASGVASLTAGSIGAQPPAHHASTHAEGGTDPLTVGDLPASVANGSVTADYVVSKIGSAVVATPANGSELPKHEGTTSQYGTVIQAAITSLKGAGHLHLALGGPVSTNDAEIVINEGLNKVNPFTPKNKLIITGDGSTQLNQTAAGKNTLTVENASTVDLSGFRLYSGASAKSALCLSSEGAESEMSTIGSEIKLYCESNSTGYPAVLIQNGYQSNWPLLYAVSTANHGLVIENTSTTTNYGNSTFGNVYVYAKKEAPYAGLRIVTTHHEKHANLMVFDFVSCVGSAYYGIYTLGVYDITFTEIDMEDMVAPIWCDGNSEGAESRGVKALSGICLPVEANPIITNTEHTAGNVFNVTIGGGSTAVPIVDESLFRAVNTYDLVLENTASANNIAITNPSTRITFRRTDGGVCSPVGTNRQSRVYTSSPKTFEPKDMGLVAEYSNSGAGSFFISKYSEQKLPVGTILRAYQAGTGKLSIATNEGVTLHNPTGYAFAQYGMVELWCCAENEWVLTPLSQNIPTSAGEWVEPTLSTKVENAPGAQTVRARAELGGNVCRLRGIAKIKSGEELKIGETLFTLPEGLRPPGHVDLTLAGSVILEIATTGVAILSTAKTSAQTIIMDGFTFNLT